MKRQEQERDSPEIVKVEEKIRSVEDRDVHLWSIMIFLCLVVTAGFAALILPNLVWESGISHKVGKHLPHLLFSLIVLVETQRMRLKIEPALSLVPDALAPPNGCCPTTAPDGLSLI